MNKKQAREAKKKRNAKTNYYIVRLTLAGSIRLNENFHDRRMALKRVDEIRGNDSESACYSVGEERRTLAMQYD